MKLDRRLLLRGAVAGGGLAALQGLMPAWAQTGSPGLRSDLPTLTGPNIDLTIGQTPFTVNGRTATATTINGVLPAQETSFEEAQPILREQLVQDRARRVIDSLITDIDDLLAGGATLEELAQETEMVLGQIDWTPQSDSEIAGYDNFRDLAGTVSAEDFPEVAELGDGGIFALRLNAVNPPSPQPLDKVRDQVAADWTRTETETRLLAQAEALAGELAEGKTFAGLGLAPTTVTGQTRSGQLPNLPGNALEALFALDAPGTLTLPHQGRAIIFRLDEITPPDFESEENQVILSALEQQVGASLAADMFEALARDIQSRVGISIDQQALNAVHANFQ